LFFGLFSALSDHAQVCLSLNQLLLEVFVVADLGGDQSGPIHVVVVVESDLGLVEERLEDFPDVAHESGDVGRELRLHDLLVQLHYLRQEVRIQTNLFTLMQWPTGQVEQVVCPPDGLLEAGVGLVDDGRPDFGESLLLLGTQAETVGVEDHLQPLVLPGQSLQVDLEGDLADAKEVEVVQLLRDRAQSVGLLAQDVVVAVLRHEVTARRLGASLGRAHAPNVRSALPGCGLAARVGQRHRRDILVGRSAEEGVIIVMLTDGAEGSG